MNWPMKWRLASTLVIVFCCGCSLQTRMRHRVLAYVPEPAVVTRPILNKTVAVLPFADNREMSNTNLTLMGLIPPFPFGWATYHVPESTQMHMTSTVWQFRPTEDIAKAVAAELGNSSFFKDVFFTYRTSQGDLVLLGEINSMKYRSYFYTYCVGPGAVFLWFVGFPVGHVNNWMELRLRLVDNSARRVLWEGSYTEEDGGLYWFYYMRSDFEYANLLKRMMKKALPSLKQKLSEIARASE